MVSQKKHLILTILLIIPSAELQYPIYPVMMYQQQVPVAVPYGVPFPYMPPPPPPLPMLPPRPSCGRIPPSSPSTTTCGPPIPTTTTCNIPTMPTTPRGIGLAVPVNAPMPPIQFAVPAMVPPTFCGGNKRPPYCPPCPPCLCFPTCTPSFFSFCSPCHQKCRCKNPDDAPVPMPIVPPRPMLGPAFPMPVPMAPAMDPSMILLPYAAPSFV